MSRNFSFRFHLLSLLLLVVVHVSESFFMTCDFKDSNVGFGDLTTCEPNLLDTSRDKTLESILSWPLNRDQSDFTQLYSEHQNVVHFPANLHLKFPNLEAIKFWDSRVKFVDNFDLRGLSKLRFLNLDDNEIEVLQADLFLFNTQLLEVHLKNNKLKYIAIRILTPLTRLKVANLQNNLCINENADSQTSLEAFKRKIDEQCSQPEFLVKKNAEFITKLVDFNYTIADLNSSNNKLEAEIKMRNQSLETCESENEDLNDKKFKIEMKFRKESSALRKLQNEMKISQELSDELTIENVKLNNELKRLNQRITEARSELLVSVPSGGSCNETGSSSVYRLKSDNNRLINDNQLLKSFKDEVEKEWRSVTLECVFVSWGGYTCQTNSFKIRTDEVEIVRVDGKHEGKKTNFDVKTFLISSQDVRTTFLPSNIGSTFPKLKAFIAQESKVVFVKRGNFDDLNSLEVLLLDRNQISDIPSDTFNDLDNLLQLDLSNNRLTKVDKEVFSKLKKLKFLALNNNMLEKLSANVFKFNQQLEVVLLQNNKIKYLGGSMLRSLTKMKLLDMKMNVCVDEEYSEVTLKQFDIRTMSHCTPPTSIECKFLVASNGYACNVVDLTVENENTMIKEVSGVHLRGKSNTDVKELSIVDQNVQHFPVDFGKYFPGLGKIFVKKSQLTTIDDNSFDLMSGVVEVAMVENELTVLSDETFQKLRNSLEIIDLSNNKISKVGTKTFHNLKMLKKLNLKGNKLQTLNSDLFNHIVNLEELRLSQNSLRSIGAHLMNNLRNLKAADFTENVCVNQKFPETSLQTLKLKILEDCK